MKTELQQVYENAEFPTSCSHGIDDQSKYLKQTLESTPGGNTHEGGKTVKSIHSGNWLSFPSSIKDPLLWEGLRSLDKMVCYLHSPAMD